MKNINSLIIYVLMVIFLFAVSDLTFAQSDSTKTKPVLINTTPPNADVFDESGFIGKTPVFASESQIHSPVIIKKNGFNDLEIEKPLTPNSVFELKPVSMTGESFKMNKNNWFRSSDDTKILIAVSGMVLSGIVAAYFKLEASENYRKYNSTKDSAFLDKTNKYDTISGIGLGGIQLSLGYLTYLLLWE